ncbi:MAG: amidohydrolase family protein [Bacillota bacterium]|nr:amidohydrolase family protein [Bacillota bacterium]
MSPLGLSVIDFHVHLPVPWVGARRGGVRSGRPPAAQKVLADYGRERREQWRREWGFPAPEEGAAVAEEQAARWAQEIERHGLRAAVMVSGGGNEKLARLIEPYRGRMFGMAHHDLAAPGAGPELRRAVEEYGLAGLKIIAPSLRVGWDDPALEPVWDYCERRRLPLLIHFGWLGTGGGVVVHPNIDPLSIYETASRHPEMPIVVAHFGCGYWQQTLQLAWSCPNIHVDTSGSNQWARWLPEPLGLEDLFRRAYETIGPRRIVFGTDSSWFPRGFSSRYLEDQVLACRHLGFKEEDIGSIFGANAARLLGISP